MDNLPRMRPHDERSEGSRLMAAGRYWTLVQ